MVYHSQVDISSARMACGFALVPLEATDAKQCPVSEALYVFRPNLLFQTFDVQGPADNVLIYGILFLNSCLRRTLSLPFLVVTFRDAWPP